VALQTHWIFPVARRLFLDLATASAAIGVTLWSAPRYLGTRSPAGQISQIEPCPSDIGKNAAYCY